MVAAVRSLGVTDENVLEKLGQVPRHRFVEQFWVTTIPSAAVSKNRRDFTVVEDCDDEALELAHEASTALITSGPTDRPFATSSVSAPIIVASMLEEMNLRPGLRVLEIGTGSGYNAALIVELVGDPSLVTTVEIDQTLVASARSRLKALGYRDLMVHGGDGVAGFAERGPFDRIVATVGCVDVVPAWIDQLGPGGELLVPLEHGAMHPRVLIHRATEGLLGEICRAIGIRADARRSGRAPALGSPSGGFRARRPAPLPDLLVAIVAPDDPERPGWRPQLWDFATYLAIREGRTIAGSGLGLRDGRSVAVIERGEISWGGPDGRDLRERLVEIARDWLTLGSPWPRPLSRALSRGACTSIPADSPGGPWALDRIDFRQSICLGE